MQLEPIVLRDEDGLRLLELGKTRNGTPFVCQHNPQHIADILAERVRRAQIAFANFRRFG